LMGIGPTKEKTLRWSIIPGPGSGILKNK